MSITLEGNEFAKSPSANLTVPLCQLVAENTFIWVILSYFESLEMMGQLSCLNGNLWELWTTRNVWPYLKLAPNGMAPRSRTPVQQFDTNYPIMLIPSV